MPTAIDRFGRRLVRHRLLRDRPVAAAIAATGLGIGAIAIRLALGPLLSGVPFITVYSAVLISSLLGGLRAGLTTAAVGGVGAWFFLVDPAWSFAVTSPSTAISLVLFAVNSSFIAFAIHWLHSLTTERELLMRELQHRVKNHIQLVASLLSLQSRGAPTPVQESLRDASLRLQAIAAVYSTLYRPGTRVDAHEVLRQLCAALQRALGRDGVRLVTNLAPLRIDAQHAVPLSLIVNELVTNAFEHGIAGRKTGQVQVSLAPYGGRGRLIVEDDGAGLDPEFRLEEQKGLGLQIARQLATQIDGSLRLEHGPPTRFVVDFDLTNPAYRAAEPHPAGKKHAPVL